MIALCSDSRVQSLLPVGGRCSPAVDASAGRGRRCCRKWERLPTCRLADLLACRFVGKLAGQGVDRRGCKRREGCRWVGGLPGGKRRRWQGAVYCPGARASKRFWRVGFHMVDVMCGKKEPGVGSRLPLLACWIADFPSFREFGKSGRQGGVLTSGSQKTTTEKKRERRWVTREGRARAGKARGGWA